MRCLLAEHWAALELRFRLRDFTDQETLAAIIRVAGGNFRLLLRLFTQFERLRCNERRMVTSEVVATARSGRRAPASEQGVQKSAARSVLISDALHSPVARDHFYLLVLRQPLRQRRGGAIGQQVNDSCSRSVTRLV